MKTAYILFALTIASGAYLLKDSDHGSEKAFAASIRAAHAVTMPAASIAKQ